MRTRSTNRPGRVTRFVVCALLIALCTACGGDEDGDDDAPSPAEGSEWGAMEWGSGTWGTSTPP